MAWRYFVYSCEEHGKFEDMQKAEERLEEIACPECGQACPRVPAFTIAKHEIEEKTHGGIVKDGKLYRRFNNDYNDVREQSKLEKTMKRAQRYGDPDTAIQAAKELGAKRKETKKKLGVD